MENETKTVRYGGLLEGKSTKVRPMTSITFCEECRFWKRHTMVLSGRLSGKVGVPPGTWWGECNKDHSMMYVEIDDVGECVAKLHTQASFVCGLFQPPIEKGEL